MLIVGVRFEMIVKVIDSFGKKCDLYFGRTGVAFVSCIIGNDLCFEFFFHNN